MESVIRWVGAEEGSMRFDATTGSGHTVVIDVAPEYGGLNAGPCPMEYVLLGAGGCSSFDVVHILKRSRQDVTGLELHISAERAETDPKVFTKIVMHFRVQGNNLNAKVVERALSLSAEVYCSASAMLSKTAEVIYTFEMQEA